MTGNPARKVTASNVVAVFLALSVVSSSLAAVWTDQADYSPGSVVTISGDNRDGAGFQTGETVSVAVEGPNGYTAACDATAGENGAWSCQVTLWDNELAIGTYGYTATGQASLVSQSGTFTDGPAKVEFKTDAPCPVVTTGSYINPGNNLVNFSASTNHQVSTKPGTAVVFSYQTSVNCSGTTYNFVSASPGSPMTSGGDGSTTTVTGHYVLADSTPPVISPSITGTLGSNGWYLGDVTLSWSVTDAQSTITSSSGCGPTDIVADQAATTYTCQATSAGGASSASVTIKRDATAPTISGSASGTAGSNGWYTSDVTVSFTCFDATSGIATCTGDASLSSEGTGQSVTGTATDQAGNSASGTVAGIDIDQTGPSAELAVGAGTPGSNGWYTSDVTVSTSGSDNLSSPVSCSADQYLAGDSAGTEFNGSCTNDAGLTTHADPLTVKRDATDPTIEGSRSPAANAYGWNNGPVTVHFECADATSGIDSCPGDTLLSGEGAGQSVTGTAVDRAGNDASDSVGDINIDLSAPTITAAVFAGALGANGWYVGDVTVRFSCGDSLSGIPAGACPADEILAAEGIAIASTAQTVSDAAGNTSAASNVVSVRIDKTAPTVAVTGVAPGDYTLGAVPAAGCTTTDTVSGVATSATLSLSGGSGAGVGSFTATCSGASDSAGNAAAPVSVTYSVRYSLSCGHSILQPINADGSSVFKRGSTVPAKFFVCDADGNRIGGAGVVASFQPTGTGSAPSDPVNEGINSTTPDTTFRWDSTAQQWIFNISTKGKEAARYWYRITLNDGSAINFGFSLK